MKKIRQTLSRHWGQQHAAAQVGKQVVADAIATQAPREQSDQQTVTVWNQRRSDNTPMLTRLRWRLLKEHSALKRGMQFSKLH